MSVAGVENSGSVVGWTVTDIFEDCAIQGVTLDDSDGFIRILNIVNSLDTPICDVETRRWEQLRSELPENVVVLTISMDLPFA